MLAVPQSQLPERYRLAIYGFRLAQYLRSRFASDRVAFARGLFAPATTGARRGDPRHRLEERTGAILRYVSVIASTDTAPLPVTHPDRAPFPCEVAHGINLFDHVPLAEPVTVREVWEIKRLMQRPPSATPPGPAAASVAGTDARLLHGARRSLPGRASWSATARRASPCGV